MLEGTGSTTVTLPDGSKRTFEWGPKALFAVPLNCAYQFFNGSGRETRPHLLHQRCAAHDQSLPQYRFRL